MADCPPLPDPTDGEGDRTDPPDADLPDSVLSARAAEGDDDAFAILVRRHSRSLLALAYRLLGNVPDAEEALQDALVNAWRRLPDFRGDATFRTWMYRIVTNRCLTVLRSRAPSVPLDAVPEAAAHDAGGQPARAAESAAATEALAQALARLRPDQRACWILRELHGLSYEEIAQVVGMSETTVRGRLFRARRTLTKEMASWR
ncbi:RNA polymerase sigma-70 factor, ECF subfamily [Actinacidiphila rubida]|uniref:RNA polymerase sigma-70 factor, ECF subfamily n=2 Tax=Actinacidiphila rubida TaxID=310780 RepID=A0A1H8EL54_9ACTN|nr:RNA polymerase sigma-70 factor, ECF subfamily [Actinacidiphila rubida]